MTGQPNRNIDHALLRARHESPWSKMLNAVLHIAVLTLLLQGFLFPLLVLMSVHWLWRARSTKAESDEEKPAESVEEKKLGGRVLRPLKCPSCGAGVPLRGTEMACVSCGTPVAAPPHYADIGRLRGEALTRLRRAAKYLRRAAFFRQTMSAGRCF